MKSSRHTFFGRLLRGAVIVLALSGALSAQDWWARFGVQGSLPVPTGDFKVEPGFSVEAGPGLGIGIFWEAPATDNLYHVVGLQANSFGGDAWLYSLSYDMQYYLQPSWQQGLYGFAGLSYMKCGANMYINDYFWGSGFQYSANNFGLDLGVGIYVTRYLGAEAKLVLATDSWSYMQLSAKWRF